MARPKKDPDSTTTKTTTGKPRGRKPKAQNPLGVIDSYKNETFSLDMAKAPYVGIGYIEETRNFRFWFSESTWHITFPEDLTPEEEKQIAKAVDQQLIIPGKTWMPAIVKDPSARNDFIEVLNTPRLDQRAKDVFRDLVKKQQVGGYTPLEILAHCKMHELQNRNRSEWILFLSEAIDAYQGPLSLVSDSPTEVTDVVVDRDSGTAQVASAPKPDTSSFSDPGMDKALRAALDK
jgi:hypothetical protein